MRGSDPPEIHDSELITTEKKMVRGRARSMAKSASVVYATKKSSQLPLPPKVKLRPIPTIRLGGDQGQTYQAATERVVQKKLHFQAGEGGGEAGATRFTLPLVSSVDSSPAPLQTDTPSEKLLVKSYPPLRPLHRQLFSHEQITIQDE